MSAEAVVIAEIFRVGADVIEGQLVANSLADPMSASVEVWQSAKERYESLPVTEETAAIVSGWVGLSDDYRALFETLGPLLTDPATAQSALQEFFAAITVFVTRAAPLDLELMQLAVAEFEQRGDPLANYLTALIDEQTTSGGAVVEIFEALELVAVDPAAGLAAMRGPIAALVESGERLGLLVPPPSAADLHGRQVALIAEYGFVFGEIIDSIDRDDALEPTAALLRMQELAVEAPQLNLDRTRFIADALAGEVV